MSTADDRKYNKIDFIHFLKSYAKDPDQDRNSVSKDVELPKEIGAEFTDRYVKIMTNVLSDHDYPERATRILNKGILNSKDKIRSEDLLALEPLIQRYGNIDVIDTKKATEIKKSRTRSVKSNIEIDDDLEEEEEELSTNPIKENNQKQTPVQKLGLQGAGNVMQQGKFSHLGNASNSDLLRFALSRNRFIMPNSIDKFIDIFETNEDTYMANPFILQQDMKDYFSPKPGEISFRIFTNMSQDFSRKGQGFFKNPYFDESGGSGINMNQQQQGQGNGQNDYNQFYYHPALPPGMSLNHPMAMRLIADYEEKQREEKIMKMKEQEKSASREAFEDYLRSKTIQVMDGGGGNNQQNNPISQIGGMVQAGLMVPVQSIDPATGNVVLKYEPRTIAEQQLHAQNQNGMGQADMLRIIQDAYGKSNEILLKYVEKQSGEDDIGRIERMKRLADVINPNSGGTSIDAQRLKLEERRLDVDHEILARREDREESRYRWETEQRRIESKESQQGAETLFKDIAGFVTGSVLPMFQGLFSGGGGAGASMPQSVGEAFQRMMGGAGGATQQGAYVMPQEQQQSNYNPYRDLTQSHQQPMPSYAGQQAGYDPSYEQQFTAHATRMQERERMLQQKEMELRQREQQFQPRSPLQQAQDEEMAAAYTQEQAQAQHQHQHQHQHIPQRPRQTYETPIEYNPQDFANMSNDEIIEYAKRGANAEVSALNFNSTINHVLKERGIIKEQETFFNNKESQQGQGGS